MRNRICRYKRIIFTDIFTSNFTSKITGIYIFILLIANFNALYAEEIFYESNSLGMVFDEVESVDSLTDSTNETEYFIGIESGGGKERRRLFSSEEETFIKTWEIYYYNEGVIHFELEYSYDELVLKQIYSRTGTVSEEIRYIDEIISEHMFFLYDENKRLISLNAVDRNEQLIYKESYAYTESGMLREVINTDSEDNLKIYSYNFGNGILIEEISKEGDLLYFTRFGTDGRLLLNELWKNTDIISRIKREYNSITGILETIIEQNFIVNSLIVKTFNEDGQLIDEMSEDEGEKKYFHDSSGRVIKIRKNSLTGIEEWNYEYNDEGDVTKEIYSFRGSIIKIIVYTDEETRYEEIYRQGKPFLRVYYEKEEKVSEELIIEQ